MDIDRIEQFLERRTSSATSLGFEQHIRRAHRLRSDTMAAWARRLSGAIAERVRQTWRRLWPAARPPRHAAW